MIHWSQNFQDLMQRLKAGELLQQLAFRDMPSLLPDIYAIMLRKRPAAQASQA